MTDRSYPGANVDESATSAEVIAGVPTSVTAFVGSTPGGPLDEPTSVRSVTEFERVFGALWPGAANAGQQTMPLAIRHFFENGGTDAVVVRTSGPTVPPPPRSAVGIYALDRVDAFNLLCLPDLAAESSGNTSGIAAALAAASAYCEARRAMLIVDPLPAWRSASDVLSATEGIEAIAAGVRGANAVLYWPEVVVAAPDSNRQITSPPSGAVAGVIARIDGTQGVWRAAAGETGVIVGIAGLAQTLSDDDTHLLNAVGVNALRTLPSVGPVVWGARTLDRAAGSQPEWQYMPVRRLALFLEESLYRGTEWVVFEPNDEPLWAAIRASIGAFLSVLHQRGAFRGATGREAYFVKCGRDTMSQDEIDAGVLNIIVGIAPLRPAEFMIVRIRQTAQHGAPPRDPAASGDNGRYRSLRYVIRSNGRIVAGFDDAAGISVADPTVDVDGEPPQTAAPSEWVAITLERGVTYDAGFDAWARSTSGGTLPGGAPGTPGRAFVLDVRDEVGGRVCTVPLTGVRASEYAALPDLDRNTNAVAIEHLKLENEA